MTLTMESFRTLPVGSVVQSDVSGSRRTFERIDEGWKHADAVLPSEFFAGDIERGHIFLGARIEVGQLWRAQSDNGFHYIVCSPADTEAGAERQWWVARM